MARCGQQQVQSGRGCMSWGPAVGSATQQPAAVPATRLTCPSTWRPPRHVAGGVVAALALAVLAAGHTRLRSVEWR